ncbi:MAG: imidazoleglycerol-phosphate dehydratase HisB [bacterium]|nr:imidazoleglycerol-phosphate dehydratase HisB [bacterium]
MRTATLTRKTRETDITLTLNLDGTGKHNIATGIGFFDHMLELFSRHALIDLDLTCVGDLHVDYHHTVEDIGLVLGQAFDQALGERRGIRRYGSMMLPMDEARADVLVDLGGRAYLVWKISHPEQHIRDFNVQLLEEFMRAFVTHAKMNLHVIQPYGAEVHHAYEAVFKGLARALRMALEDDPRETGIPSSKGKLDL